MTPTLREKITGDIKLSIKRDQRHKLSVLRGILSEVVIEEKKSTGATLNNEQVLSVILREKKKYEEALGFAHQAGREDLCFQNTTYLEIIAEYLPEQLVDEEVIAMIAVIIHDHQITNIQEIGKVMKVLSPTIKGKYDGKKATELVKTYFSFSVS